MFDDHNTSLLDLSGAIFGARPTPPIAYSRSDGVVLLANRAARRFFAMPYFLVGRSVTRMPIVSTVSGIQLKHLLLGKPTGPRHPSERRYQDFWEADYSHESVMMLLLRTTTRTTCRPAFDKSKSGSRVSRHYQALFLECRLLRFHLLVKAFTC